MKTILAVILIAFAFSGGGCSRTEDQPATVERATPNLKSDAERLQQATAKAAEERKRAQAAESPTAPPQ